MRKPVLFDAKTLNRIEEGTQIAFRRPLLPRPQEVDGETVWAAPPGRGEYSVRADEVGKLRIDHSYLSYPVGLQLWCREPWAEISGAVVIKRTAKFLNGDVCIDFLPGDPDGIFKWERPTGMPEEYAQILLEIRHVDVARLHDATAGSILAEGYGHGGVGAWSDAWDDKYGAKEGLAFSDNPYTVVCEFRRLTNRS